MLKQVQHDGFRTDWTRDEIAALFDLPFTELVFPRRLGSTREHHAADEVQLCTLLSIKTGGLPGGLRLLLAVGPCRDGPEGRQADGRRRRARQPRARQGGGIAALLHGARHGAAPKDRDIPAVAAMVAGVRAIGLETCMTLGMLSFDQALQLKEAGLDYYNHNIDTSPENYGSIISTRTFDDRLETLENVREAGINVCCGGIVGMGETRADRVGFVHALATMPRHPESVPVNALVPVKGTVLGDMLADTPLAKIDDVEFVRTVAVARIAMPRSMVRLSAGRESMSEATQALCFLAGANSIFTGDKLLTTGNRGDQRRRRAVRQAGAQTAGR